jgi:hypothetical protein
MAKKQQYHEEAKYHQFGIEGAKLVMKKSPKK